MASRYETETTITKSELTKQELHEFDILIKLGDSEIVALWTIEHMTRKKKNNNEFYRFAYEN